MTRKRFIKLMMAKGFSRNSAKRISLNVVEEKRNYAEVYAEWEWLNTAILEIDFTEVATAFVTAIKSTVEVIAENLIHFIRAFSDAINKKEPPTRMALFVPSLINFFTIWKCERYMYSCTESLTDFLPFFHSKFFRIEPIR